MDSRLGLTPQRRDAVFPRTELARDKTNYHKEAGFDLVFDKTHICHFL